MGQSVVYEDLPHSTTDGEEEDVFTDGRVSADEGDGGRKLIG